MQCAKREPRNQKDLGSNSGTTYELSDLGQIILNVQSSAAEQGAQQCLAPGDLMGVKARGSL